MPDIIEIKIENPYLRVNYDYVVDRMENEGCMVIVHSQREVLDLGKNIVRRGHRFKMSKKVDGSYTVMIRMPDDRRADNNERVKLLLKGGKAMSVETYGQIKALRTLYTEKFLEGQKKIRSEESGVGIYCMARIGELKELKGVLANKILGQEEAICVIADAVLNAECGFKKAQRPKSGMLLLGPTGVGKTEVVLSLAEFLYKDSSRVKRFDMAEYQRQESLGWLLGNNKEEQGLLGDAIDALNEKGGGILLFDEIEKAHQSLTTIFLSALDAGRISMSNGQTKDLSQIYIFFTSNLGGNNAAQMINANPVTVRKSVERCARSHFSPELFARFDEVVVFQRLTYEAQLGICKRIIGMELEHLSQVLGKKLTVSDEVFNFLIQKGYTRDLGARMMRRTVEREIGNALVSWKLNSDNEESEALAILVENFKLIAA